MYRGSIHVYIRKNISFSYICLYIRLYAYNATHTCSTKNTILLILRKLFRQPSSPSPGRTNVWQTFYWIFFAFVSFVLRASYSAGGRWQLHDSHNKINSGLKFSVRSVRQHRGCERKQTAGEYRRGLERARTECNQFLSFFLFRFCLLRLFFLLMLFALILFSCECTCIFTGNVHAIFSLTRAL